MRKDYKPWEEHPELWKTESQFWTYLRGCIRRGIWEKSPIKLSFKNNDCELPPKGYQGRAKSGQYCALSGKWEGKSKLEVDHIEGNVSLSSWDDVIPFIQHMIPEKGTLQLVTKEAHKIKSHQEKQGFQTFEEAACDKEAIQICKGDEKVWLLSRGIEPESNAKLRREQVFKQLLKELLNK